MASKFAKFIEDKKIDPRRIIVASRQIERLRREDRRLKLQKRRGKGDEGAAKAEGEGEAPAKPRSGRVVTPQLLRKATEGQPVPGPAKQRLVRAVNRLLEQKKQDPVDLRTLF